MIKKLKIIAISCVFIYACLVGFLFLQQRSMVFVPNTSTPALPAGMEWVEIKTKDHIILRSGYVPAKNNQKPTLVFFHGNSGNISHRFYKVEHYARAGYGILLVGYRGYGGNPGQPSEQGFYHDGRANLNWLIKNQGVDNIVLYGESIGSGPATQLATEYDIQGLVLEVPFSSLLDIAQNRYFFIPVKPLLKDPFMNWQKIAHINAPLLILHGHKDVVTPYKFAKKLYDHAIEPKKMIDFPEGAHNNLYDFGAHTHILNFLDTLDK